MLVGHDTEKDSVVQENVRNTDISERAQLVIDTFPPGTMVESTIGMGGPSEVFIECDTVQPFSYLDDWDIKNYRKSHD